VKQDVQMMGYGGDFGDPIHDAQFCCNGLAFPTRQPHPGLWEVKHVQAPVAFSVQDSWSCPESMPSGGFEVPIIMENRYDFLDLTHLDVQWRLLVGGMPVVTGADLQRATRSGALDLSFFVEVWIHGCAF
jgi:beta-galactosidase